MAAALLPLDPLEQLARSQHENGSGPSRPFSDAVFAEMIGVARQSVVRWRANGNRLPWHSADAASVNLGRHPLSLWGDAWADIDHGIYDGTDKDAIAEVIRSLTKVGKVMRASVPQPA